jgi:putative heme degradation protein
MLSQVDWENIYKMLHMICEYGVTILVFVGLYKIITRMLEGGK